MQRVLFALKLLVVVVLWVGQAHAGPWPREEGEGFFSFTIDTNLDDVSDNFFSFYVEYGLSDTTTLGIDRRERSDVISKTIAFLRWPIGPEDRDVKLAYEMGVGVVENELALRPGFSVGRGFDSSWAAGWFTVDSRALLFDSLDEALFEADFTLGLNASERSKVILQIQSGVPTEGDAYAKLAPSFVYQHKPGRSYVLGLTAGVIGIEEVQLNLGLWQKF